MNEALTPGQPTVDVGIAAPGAILSGLYVLRSAIFFFETERDAVDRWWLSANNLSKGKKVAENFFN